MAISQFEELFLISCQDEDTVMMFFLWEHGEDSLKQFLKNLNSVHPNLEFTSDYSTEKI